MFKPLSKYWLLVSLIIIAIDQFSKYLVIHYQADFIYNNGIAFSLPLRNNLALFTGLALIILLIKYGSRLYGGNKQKLFTTCSGLVIGGAFSNIIDRVSRPGVIDFIKLPYWPIFNLADASVCIGIAIMMILIYQDQKNDPNKGQNP